MQFIGIEIAPAGTKAVVLDLDSAEILAEASISHSWIDGLPPGYREQEPTRWIEATASTVMPQLLADALGVPVVPVSSRHGSDVGAAIQAAVAFFHQCWESLGFEEICSYLVSGNPERRCDPDPENHSLYQHRMARQQYLVDTLHPASFI